MSTAQTKEVQGYFGPKQITREAFIKRWTDHFAEISHLTYTSEQLEWYKEAKAKIVELAGQRWDRMD